jgi:hypothetical protein
VQLVVQELRPMLEAANGGEGYASDHWPSAPLPAAAVCSGPRQSRVDAVLVARRAREATRRLNST